MQHARSRCFSARSVHIRWTSCIDVRQCANINISWECTKRKRKEERNRRSAMCKLCKNIIIFQSEIMYTACSVCVCACWCRTVRRKFQTAVYFARSLEQNFASFIVSYFFVRTSEAKPNICLYDGIIWEPCCLKWNTPGVLSHPEKCFSVYRL